MTYTPEQVKEYCEHYLDLTSGENGEPLAIGIFCRCVVHPYVEEDAHALFDLMKEELKERAQHPKETLVMGAKRTVMVYPQAWYERADPDVDMPDPNPGEMLVRDYGRSVGDLSALRDVAEAETD